MHKIEFLVVQTMKCADGTCKRGQLLIFPGDAEFLQPSAQYVLAWTTGKPASQYPLAPAANGVLEYLLSIPAPEKNIDEQVKRLACFLAYLEHPSPIVSEDAHLEFSQASPETIERLAGHFLISDLRRWVDDPATLDSAVR